MPDRTFVRIAAACIASGLLSAAVPRAAGAGGTIRLRRGAVGTPSAPDPNVAIN